MSGKKVLLDSNIIIYLSKGLLNFDEILNDYDQHSISIITYMEMLGYDFTDSNEEKLIRKFMQLFDIIHLEMEIANEVISLRKKKKIKLPDAIILSSAKLNNHDLMTFNLDDFENIESDVHIFKPPIKDIRN